MQDPSPKWGQACKVEIRAAGQGAAGACQQCVSPSTHTNISIYLSQPWQRKGAWEHYPTTWAAPLSLAAERCFCRCLRTVQGRGGSS